MKPFLIGMGIVLIAAALRLPFGDDIEYKPDERFTFEQVQAIVAHGEPIPSLGMPMSAGPANPGMSLWVFLGVAEVLPADDPPSLARGVAIFSVVAIGLLVLFAYTCVPPTEREPWLWAALFVAASPMVVIFHRKIWPPSLFPVVTMLFLLGWWYRDRRWGAFLWGVVAALLGQINIPGFFFSAGFALWAFLFDRQRTRWRWLIAGGGVGLLPMLPWWIAWWNGSLGEVTRGPKWYHLIDMGYFRRWVQQSAGFGLDHAFTKTEWRGLLAYPRILGVPTYLAGLAHVVMAGIAVVVLGRAAKRWIVEPKPWRDKIVRHDSPTGFTLSAALWGYGIVLALTCMPVHRHYLMVLFALPMLWFARLALGERGSRPSGARAMLAVMAVAMVIVSASFLRYVHDNPRSLGEYGTPYSAQTPAEAP